jgi:cytochrome P450
MPVDEHPRPYPFETFHGDLPDELLTMVRTDPVTRVTLPDGRLAWLVLGYSEVSTVLSDPRIVRHTDATSSIVDGHEQVGCPVRDLSMNGEPHTSLRRLASRAFTPRQIETYRPRVQQLTDELLDDMAAAGQPADLVAALIAPLPTLVICEMLGVPAADREQFNTWTVDMLSLTAHGSEQAGRSTAEMRAYLLDRLHVKRRGPGPDLLSAWLEAQRHETLHDEEIVGLALGVLLGGREINSVSAGLRALFAHPDQMAQLRAEPQLMPGAVEEILRYTAVSAMFLVQTVVADIEVGGVQMRAGDAVMAMPWAANRQPEMFDRAEVFDIRRRQNPHLAFGYGPHFCLGAALGRLLIDVELSTLLRRFPGLAPAVALTDLPWRQERFNCGIAEFPVAW